MIRQAALLVLPLLMAVSAHAEDVPAEPAAANAPSADDTDGEANAKKCELVVLNLAALGLDESEKHISLLLSDAIAAEISSVSDCKVMTQNDIKSMMDFEAEKAACGVDSTSCLAEIAGALGVSRIVTGSIGRLGTSYKLQVKLHDVTKGSVVARIDRTINGDATALDVAAKNAGRELMNVELLEEPKSVATAEAENGGDAQASEGVSWLGLGLLGGGAVGLAVGTIAVLVGGTAMYFVEQDAGAPSDDDRDMFKKNELQGWAWGSLAVTGLGLCGTAFGLGALAGGLLIE